MADFDRFRSFAERYIIERAAGFAKGTEREEAWAATLDAKTIYNNVARSAADAEMCDNVAGKAAQASTQQAYGSGAPIPGANKYQGPQGPQGPPGPPSVTAPVTPVAHAPSPRAISLTGMINAIMGKESNGQA